MTDDDKRATAARLNGDLNGLFDPYLRGVATFEECAVQAIDELLDEVATLGNELAKYGHG